MFLGKTNIPEFALWWETDNLVFGRTLNPWNAGRIAGGSSGGEAAVLAAGLSPLGLGSDVGRRSGYGFHPGVSVIFTLYDGLLSGDRELCGDKERP